MVRVFIKFLLSFRYCHFRHCAASCCAAVKGVRLRCRRITFPSAKFPVVRQMCMQKMATHTKPASTPRAERLECIAVNFTR
ncbi:unnamed protein product [Tuber melanosporum]|uniref:(Perigord truffle) hypothetical protein n=1 Tax=Tuber melanosporum (strain Mel28) TaxID=656061 RepID=D5G758_TUBMM|nr:uncharacterized protein GSTUM_00002353001 [Tuber melanosporum]CAZ80351.1 unnamed protein product [Tuber melanosporum]